MRIKYLLHFLAATLPLGFILYGFCFAGDQEDLPLVWLLFHLLASIVPLEMLAIGVFELDHVWYSFFWSVGGMIVVRMISWIFALLPDPPSEPN